MKDVDPSHPEDSGYEGTDMEDRDDGTFSGGGFERTVSSSI
ncbi:MAG: hypothetical protein R3B56_11750 [Candidatus Scalinduaceae bacterium]